MESNEFFTKAERETEILLAQKGYATSSLAKRGRVWQLKDKLGNTQALFCFQKIFDGRNKSIRILQELAQKYQIPFIIVSESNNSIVYWQFFSHMPGQEEWKQISLWWAFPKNKTYPVSSIYEQTKQHLYWFSLFLIALCLIWMISAILICGICSCSFIKQLPFILIAWGMALFVYLFPWISLIKLGTDGLTIIKEQQNDIDKEIHKVNQY